MTQTLNLTVLNILILILNPDNDQTVNIWWAQIHNITLHILIFFFYPIGTVCDLPRIGNVSLQIDPFNVKVIIRHLHRRLI